MTTSSKKNSEDELNLVLFSVPQEVLLQLGTATALGVLLGGKAFFETLQAIGQASEEVFRGDRLPVLKVSVETESEPS